MRSSPISSTGSADGSRAPQRRAQPREQLVDAERLRHVVVGAGVERRDLLALVADDREDDHRHGLHVRSSRHDLGAAHVGEHEIEDDRVGRATAAAVKACSAGRRGVDVVAGAAQARLQRAQDLRLVVDDEDAASSSASASTKCPPPARPRPRRARRSPRRSRARSRARGRRRARRRRRAGTARRPPRGRPARRPARGRRRGRSSSVAARARRARAPAIAGGENFSALSSRLTSARSICAASTLHRRRVAVELGDDALARGPSCVERARDESSAVQSSWCGSATPLRAARGRAGCRRRGRAARPRLRIVATSSSRSASARCTLAVRRGPTPRRRSPSAASAGRARRRGGPRSSSCRCGAAPRPRAPRSAASCARRRACVASTLTTTAVTR